MCVYVFIPLLFILISTLSVYLIVNIQGESSFTFTTQSFLLLELQQFFWFIIKVSVPHFKLAKFKIGLKALRHMINFNIICINSHVTKCCRELNSLYDETVVLIGFINKINCKIQLKDAEIFIVVRHTIVFCFIIWHGQVPHYITFTHKMFLMYL